jgi:hypothetical protein
VRRLTIQAAFALSLVSSALVVFCCGPKLKPPVAAVPLCPGDTDEICEVDEIGPHDCYCPE